MGPKKPKKEEEPDDQFMKMNASQLVQNLNLFKQKVNDFKSKRNYIQMDRDMVQQYYHNTEAEIEELKLQILNAETEAENIEKNHNVQVKVYMQKVRHLQYEEERANIDIENDGEGAKGRENEYFNKRIETMKNVKHDLKKRHMEHEKKYIEACEILQSDYRSKQELLRKQHERNLAEDEKKYEERLARLKEELELKLKVEIHEVEERKNRHINELINKHEEDFTELKNYYNDITRDNLNLIREHKAVIRKINQESTANKKLIEEMKEENEKLKGPLQGLRRESNRLKTLLKQFEKHKNSLQNYKSKYQNLKEKIFKLQKDSKQLGQKLTQVDEEKKRIQENFEKSANEVRRHSEMYNKVLSQRLMSLIDQLEDSDGKLHQTLQQASLDPANVEQIKERIKNSIESKNTLIKNLQYSIHHATKAYNDAIRVYEAKLVEFGIPADELGFQPLQTITSTMPAGLVSS